MEFDDQSLGDQVRGMAGVTVSVKPHGDDGVVIVIDDVEWNEEKQVWQPWCFVSHHGVPLEQFDAVDFSDERMAGLGAVVLSRLAARLRQTRKNT